MKSDYIKALKLLEIERDHAYALYVSECNRIHKLRSEYQRKLTVEALTNPKLREIYRNMIIGAMS